MKVKRFWYILLLMALLLSTIVIYFYAQAAVEVEQVELDKNLPPKLASAYKFDGYHVVYIPYKFKVKNNRLIKLEDTRMLNLQKYTAYINESDLVYDSNDFPVGLYPRKYEDLDQMLQDYKLLDR